MTREECVTLTEYIAEICPHQKIGPLTGIAWFDILGNLGKDECRKAAAAIASRQPFVAPSEIIAEIAAEHAASMPHSNACRTSDCSSCRTSWCNCTCHPRTIQALTTGEKAPPRAAIASPFGPGLATPNTRPDPVPLAETISTLRRL